MKCIREELDNSAVIVSIRFFAKIKANGLESAYLFFGTLEEQWRISCYVRDALEKNLLRKDQYSTPAPEDITSMIQKAS
ncbi:hypothetical protein [Heliorestis convoluta]|uniref:Uncharacterized protein n=1 Tax=Heliorestis convoluta TaxID=356322 RepID=A0A5Q2MWH9_9FIRM|nr:hypothetical protein [Heliorestis convoluta]QGG46758.1 hypothetical protein FTV88_0579 [Heliorestis convoluta]